MLQPELTVHYSQSVGLDLDLYDLQLLPDAKAAAVLNERVGRKPDAAISALLLRANEVDLPPAGHVVAQPDPDVPRKRRLVEDDPDDEPIRVYVTEFSEQEILVGFTRALVEKAQFEKRMRALSRTAVGIMTAIGSASLAPVTPWAALGVPVAFGYMGVSWLREKKRRGSLPPMPDIKGLKSPVKLTPHRMS
jgi:hypothetical protein